MSQLPLATAAEQERVITRASRSKITLRDEFQRFAGTTLFIPFTFNFIDQVMLGEVNAGVEWTGRIRNTPIDRGIRSAAAEQILFVGFEHDKQAMGRWLLDMHRDVKGTKDGVRFSALKPENWNWIMLSAIMAQQNSFTPITGRRLTDAERQDFYEFQLDGYEGLRLPGSSQLPETWREATAYYDSLLADKGRCNSMVRLAFIESRKNLASRAALHINMICSIGSMRPNARRLTGYEWTSRRDLEYKAICRILPIAYHRLPKRLTLFPMAYHRWHYEKHVRRYWAAQRDSFCPAK